MPSAPPLLPVAPQAPAWPSCVWTRFAAAQGAAQASPLCFRGLPQLPVHCFPGPGSLLASALPALSGVWPGGQSLTYGQVVQWPHGTLRGVVRSLVQNQGRFQDSPSHRGQERPCWAAECGLEGDRRGQPPAGCSEAPGVHQRKEGRVSTDGFSPAAGASAGLWDTDPRHLAATQRALEGACAWPRH